MARALSPVLGVMIVLSTGAPLRSQEEPSQGDVAVSLELSQQFYYAGEPLPVRVSVRNGRDRRVTNPVKSPLLRSFVVRDERSEPLTPAGDPGVEEPSRPEKLAPLSFYGAVVDLTRIYPDLKKVGKYEITWSADGLSSPTLIVRMLPKYDPAKTYVATLETSEGNIVINFLRDTSPIAVKAFIDMANAGFYDELLFHEIRRDHYIVGGDPQYSKEPRIPFLYPSESSSAPLVAGTVVMKPARPAPPSNGPQFVVLLRPEPAWVGQVTVLGQVTQGMEVARRISRLPSTLESSSPHFKPLKDVVIRRVVISEKETAPATR
jgi:cyclophilin family peptidyl-prolyl cis-trans isomerase